jgi:hypothetical protein
MNAERPVAPRVATNLAESEASRLLDVLDFAKTKGFTSFGDLARSFFDSEDALVKKRVGLFFRNGGFKTLFGGMIKHTRFGPNRRITSNRTAEFLDEVGAECQDLLLRVFRHELLLLAKDPRTRKAPTSITPEDCESFSFQYFSDIYQEVAPFLSRIIEELCGVTSDEERQEAGIYVDPAPEDMQDDADDEWNDGDGFGMPGDPEVFVNADEDEDAQRSEEEMLFTYVEANAGDQAKKKRRRRRKRDKGVVVATVISQILFTRSRWQNGFAVRVPLKEWLAIMNRTNSLFRQCLVTTCRAQRYRNDRWRF